MRDLSEDSVKVCWGGGAVARSDDLIATSAWKTPSIENGMTLGDRQTGSATVVGLAEGSNGYQPPSTPNASQRLIRSRASAAVAFPAVAALSYQTRAVSTLCRTPRPASYASPNLSAGITSPARPARSHHIAAVA